jgi:membrane protein DedA with SNARE-associated domain
MQAIAAAKFLPGVGAVMAPLAGMFRVSTGRFVLFDGLGSILYGSGYLLLGFLFRNQLEGVLELLSRLGLGVLVLILAIIAAYIAFKLVQRWRLSHQQKLLEPTGLPATQIQVCSR